MKKLHTAIDQKLLKKMQLLDRMTASARSRLPEDWAKHCWVGDHDTTCLNIVTDNAVFIMPVFYQQVEILKQLNEEFGTELKCHFKKMKVRTMRNPMPAHEKDVTRRVTDSLEGENVPSGITSRQRRE